MSYLLSSLPAPVALVTGAGEQNCAAQAGMLEPVLASGWRPDLSVGSSGGAITAAVVATHADAHEAMDLWRRVAASKPARPGLSRLAAAAASSDSSRVTRAWRTVLEPTFGDTELDGLGAHLVAANLTTRKVRVYESGPVVSALLAAAAHPVLANPVIEEGDVIIDGGFIAPIPVLQAIEAGAKSLVVLDTGRPSLRGNPEAPTRWYRVTLEAIRHQLDSKASLDTARAAATVPIVLLSTPEPGWVGWDEVEARIAAGRNCATEQLTSLAARWASISQPGVYTAADEVRLDRRLGAHLR